LTTTAGCVLSSAQLNTLEKVSAVRSQRPVQAERSVFAGRGRGDTIAIVSIPQVSKTSLLVRA
jgi:hypothetical protein